ncbi:helix-turn-helix transcriptional regulator [Raoultibacter phocaeensis]|uniref:helix-turn-helix transcriptional regulator n=1 Tax=Raoultibacter phocaeensis TaxID=2479841 RepID=UPI0015D59E18|nr:helix-turn-helix transcriptional regulator [Raoultibacter phocaeensis]
MRVCGFFVLAASFFAATRLYGRFENRPVFVLGAGGGAALVAVLFSSVLPHVTVPPLWIGIIVWSAHGFSLAFLMFAWALCFSENFDSWTAVIVAVGYVVGFSMFFLYSLTVPFDNTASSLFLGFTSAAVTTGMLAFLLFAPKPIEHARDRTPESIPAGNLAKSEDASPESTRISLKAFSRIVYSTTCGINFGFAIILLQSIGTMSVSYGAVGGIIGCSIALVAILAGALSRGADIRRIGFVPVAAPLLFLPLGGIVSYILCSIPIIATSIFTATISWYTTARKSSSKHRGPIEVFSKEKLPGWFGLFIGAIVCEIAVSSNTEVFTIIIAALVALICVAFAFLEFCTYNNTDEQHMSPQQNPEQGEVPTRRFRDRCDAIAQAYGLTPREAEVLVLLAKGYHADFISAELSIARPTTRTHIQHIYQKLTINSQQELIHIVDAW